MELPGITVVKYLIPLGKALMGMYAPTRNPITALKIPLKAPLAEDVFMKLITNIISRTELVTDRSKTPILTNTSDAVI